jgi:hypothetical protein
MRKERKLKLKPKLISGVKVEVRVLHAAHMRR